MSHQDPNQLFDSYYYAHGCGRPYQRDEEWLRFFGGIARRIKLDLAPGSVLDAGCALGFLVEGLRKEGVEAFGIDISEFAIENADASIQPFLKVGSIANPFERSFDLIVNIEVLEHMPAEQALQAVENFCRFSQAVLFSSTPLDYKEATHLTVREPEFWAEAFARHGFYRDVDFDASFITPWAVLFRRREVTQVRLVREYERKFFQLWKENSDLRASLLEMRSEISDLHIQHQALQAEAEDGRRRAQELENEIAAIRSSRSWKMIASLARLRSLFSGKRG